jgi:hypothetical protein
MAKQKKEEQPVDGVKATRELTPDSVETRTFSYAQWALIGSDPEHNGGWLQADLVTPTELAADLDPEL